MEFLRRILRHAEHYIHVFVKSRPLQVAVVIVAILFSYSFFTLFVLAPKNFPTGSFVVVEKGETLSSTTVDFSNRNIIDHPTLFKLFVRLFGGQGSVKAGDYYFPIPSGVISVAYRLSHGNFDVENVKITVPEGLSTAEIGKLLEVNLPHIKAKSFAAAAKNFEGYLFPDTYYFLPSATSVDVIEAMKNNFDTHIAPLKDDITAFGKPLKDIIIMASILEEEARTMETRRTIAGILWKRLSIGMPLQVDAVFPYILGKTPAQITLDDLKIESPYNTYLHKGLPPGPIANPGLDAIRASLTPINTKYFYYLSDSDGVMHYAVTHDEHVANKEKYLR